MSLSTQFDGGSRNVSQLFGYNGVQFFGSPHIVRNARSGTPASWVSGAFQTLLSVTGRGTLNFAALRTTDATARTLRLRISIDGRASPYLFDQSSALSTSAATIVGVGGLKYSIDGSFGWLTADFQPIPFSTSLLIEASNTLTEAGTSAEFLYNHEVNV